MTLREHEAGKPACPHCGSRNMQQLLTDFIAHTSIKS
jgi:hypothetical protein